MSTARKQALQREVEALSDEVSRLRVLVDRSIEATQQWQRDKENAAGKDGVPPGAQQPQAASLAQVGSLGAVPFLSPDQPLSVLPTMFTGPQGTARLFRVLMDTYPWLVPPEVQKAKEIVAAEEGYRLAARKVPQSKLRPPLSESEEETDSEEEDREKEKKKKKKKSKEKKHKKSSSGDDEGKKPKESEDQETEGDSASSDESSSTPKKRSSKKKKGNSPLSSPKGSEGTAASAQGEGGSPGGVYRLPQGPSSSRSLRSGLVAGSSTSGGSTFNPSKLTPKPKRGLTKKIAALHLQDEDDDEDTGTGTAERGGGLIRKSSSLNLDF